MAENTLGKRYFPTDLYKNGAHLDLQFFYREGGTGPYGVDIVIKNDPEIPYMGIDNQTDADQATTTLIEILSYYFAGAIDFSGRSVRTSPRKDTDD